MITVLIPTLLRTITDGQARILTWPGNVRAIIEDINTRFPGFKTKIYEDTGKVRRGINLFVNEEDIRFLDGLDTLLSSSSGDVLDIVPAIAGGTDLITAYPLCWPAGWPRESLRVAANHFKGNTLYKANSSLKVELQRLGASDIILSSNVHLRIDGEPKSDWERFRITDPGVAVYFVLRRGGADQGREIQMVMARDVYNDPASNLRSLGLAVEHLRGLERHGGGTMLEKAFTGFTALPAPGDPRKRTWRQVFMMEGTPDPPKSLLTQQYRDLSYEKHPDHGGSNDLMAELNEAYEQAKTELGY